MAAIPNRAVFRSQEVCEIADVQLYVLRTWEAEFPDLGVSKSADGPRLYRRSDVELVLKLKHLLFVDGLTLAGAQHQLVEEGVAPAAIDDTQTRDDTITDADVAALVDKQTRKGLQDVRQGLGWILEVLNGGVTSSPDRRAKPVRLKGKPAPSRKPAARAGANAKASRKSKPAPKTKRSARGGKKK